MINSNLSVIIGFVSSCWLAGWCFGLFLVIFMSVRANEMVASTAGLDESRSPRVLFSFERPFHVVSTWPNAPTFLDQVFQVDPEAHLLERIVQPARRYTKVSVMWRHVVNTMMYAGQNEMHFLQNSNVPWQTKVSMLPLVKLEVSEKRDVG